MKITKYGVIECGDYIAISTDVHEWMKIGWQPLGGVCAVFNPIMKHMRYTQAMVQYA